MHEPRLIRVTQPDIKGGTSHIVPAANRNTYLQRNSALMRGQKHGYARPDLLVTIEDLTEEEHRAHYDNLYRESKELSAKAKRTALENPKPQGVSEALVLELMAQNKAANDRNAELMERLAKLEKGQQNGKREKATA